MLFCCCYAIRYGIACCYVSLLWLISLQYYLASAYVVADERPLQLRAPARLKLKFKKFLL